MYTFIQLEIGLNIEWWAKKY